MSIRLALLRPETGALASSHEPQSASEFTPMLLFREWIIQGNDAGSKRQTVHY